MISNLLHDLKYAIRRLRKDAGAHAVAAISLALGLGANAAIFSLIDGVLLKPLPVKQPERLVEVWHHRNRAANAFMADITLSYPDYRYLRDNNKVFAEFGGFVPEIHKMTWDRDGAGQPIWAQIVSDDFFKAVGLRPAAGNFLRKGSEASEIVISYSLWKKLGGDADMLGESWVLNGRALQVVGVAPPRMNSLTMGQGVDVWMSVQDARAAGWTIDQEQRFQHCIIGLGRLKSGVQIADAESNIKFLGQQLAKAFPDSNANSEARAFLAQLMPGPRRSLVTAFAALLLAVTGLVLLIGCANASNVLLAQASVRNRELAIRSAVGATRRRLIVQMLDESVLLALLSGVIAYFVSSVITPVLLRLFPADLRLDLDLSADWRVGLFVGLFSLATGLIVGVFPAFRSTKMDLIYAMKAGRHGAVSGSASFRNGLVVAQIAVCMVLLVAGALCYRSLRKANSVRPGFNPDHLFVSSLELQPLGFGKASEQRFYEQLISALTTAPGVRSVSITNNLPLGQKEFGAPIRVPGIESPKGLPGWPVLMADVAPAYFQTMQIGLLRGREFTWWDGKRSPNVVVINSAMARQFWHNSNPLGKTIEILGPGTSTAAQVVGVVETGKYRSLGEDETPFLYRPLLQNESDEVTVIVRLDGDPASFASSFRTILRDRDSRLAMFEAGSMRQELQFATVPERVSGVLFGTGGVIALILALTGVCGVIVYVVAQKTKEIGVRLALGADHWNVLGMILFQSFKLVATGMAIGLLLAAGATRLLGSYLYGVGATDLPTFAAASLGLLLLAMTASYVPARAAMKLDPAQSLREE